MISRFSDHAANERTYLAWIRTAIVVMGFGFLIERFSLVMQQLELMPKTQSAMAQKLGLHLGSVAGLIMILMGLGIINRGTRPSAPKDQRTASAYIFGAICPA